MNPRVDINPMLEMLKTRRSPPVVALAGPGPRPDEIEELLKIAARVPDHGKLAPWRFVLFEGEARSRAGDIVAAEFARRNPEAAAEAVETERKRFSYAPLVVGVVSRAAAHAKIPEWEQVLSAGAVCMTLEIAAQGMGYRSAWLTQWYSYDANVRAALGLSEHERIAGFVHIGSCAGMNEDRVRPELADIVTRF